MASAHSPRTRPITGAYWKNSKAAKADAVQWVNQRNIRIVLEHLTSEVLQTLPEDPLEFMITTLQKGQEQMSTADRPGTAMSTRPATAKSLGKGEDEMLETMQKELDNWRILYEQEAAKAQALEEEIKELEEKLTQAPPADED